jgi:hypothetical protein
MTNAIRSPETTDLHHAKIAELEAQIAALNTHIVQLLTNTSTTNTRPRERESLIDHPENSKVMKGP